MTDTIIQMVLELWRGWCCDCLSSEQSFPSFQSELCLTQLHSFPLCPISGHQREEITTFPPLSPFKMLQTALNLLFSKLNKTNYQGIPRTGEEWDTDQRSWDLLHVMFHCFPETWKFDIKGISNGADHILINWILTNLNLLRYYYYSVEFFSP